MKGKDIIILGAAGVMMTNDIVTTQQDQKRYYSEVLVSYDHWTTDPISLGETTSFLTFASSSTSGQYNSSRV